MKKFLVTLLSLIFLGTGINAAHAEIITLPCIGGTYSVEMPASRITKSNGCTGNLVIDPSIKSIGDTAFQWAKITSVTIPNSVTSIGNSAFSSSTLTSVVIPSSVISLGRSAFESSEIRSVVISGTLTEISDSAFGWTKNLTSAVIPSGVTKIGNFAFWYSGLVSVEIPRSVTSIGNSAFSSTKLTKVDIPDSVDTIGYGAFNSISNLTAIIYCGPAASGLPTTPTCPSDRKAIIDAKNKAAADKAAADKAAADAKAATDRVAADAKAAADRAAIQAAQDAKKLTISCKKGSTTRRVTGESPVCPKGFTNSLDKHLTFQAFSKCKLYKKDSSIGGVSLLDNGATLKFSSAGKYSSFLASAGSYVDVACSLLVMKAPSFVTAQIDSTRALDGLQKATWGRLSAFWTYHPDNGLNISINSN
jgi:hypothetical protein